MNDDELFNQLQAHAGHLDSADSGTIDRTLQSAHDRASYTSQRRRNSRRVSAAIMLASVAIAAGALWRYADRTATIRVSTAETANVTTTSPRAYATTVSPPATLTATTVAVLPTVAKPTPAVTSRIEVLDTIVAGTQADAALVVDNNTGGDITIPGCAPMWAITLTNASHPANASFTLPCFPSLVISVGQTRLRRRSTNLPKVVYRSGLDVA
jgi:cytoskeletal protein RodZ